MKSGGFPELMNMKDRRSYVRDLVNNILTRDIEQRYKIHFTAAFEQMAHHLLNISPAVIVDKDMSTLFKFKSVHTFKNYLNYMTQAYLLIGLNKYSHKSRQRITEKKIYPIDVAMMNQRDNAFEGENIGWRLQTIVYIELLRRCKTRGQDIYYLGNRSGECDFIICEGNKTVQAIQVSYDISNPKTYRREISGLLLAANKTKCNNLLLLTDHVYEETEKNGYNITIRPVYDWTLNNE